MRTLRLNAPLCTALFDRLSLAPAPTAPPDEAWPPPDPTSSSLTARRPGLEQFFKIGILDGVFYPCVGETIEWTAGCAVFLLLYPPANAHGSHPFDFDTFRTIFKLIGNRNVAIHNLFPYSPSTFAKDVDLAHLQAFFAGRSPEAQRCARWWFARALAHVNRAPRAAGARAPVLTVLGTVAKDVVAWLRELGVVERPAPRFGASFTVYEVVLVEHCDSYTFLFGAHPSESLHNPSVRARGGLARTMLVVQAFQTRDYANEADVRAAVDATADARTTAADDAYLALGITADELRSADLLDRLRHVHWGDATVMALYQRMHATLGHGLCLALWRTNMHSRISSDYVDYLIELEGVLGADGLASMMRWPSFVMRLGEPGYMAEVGRLLQKLGPNVGVDIMGNSVAKQLLDPRFWHQLSNLERLLGLPGLIGIMRSGGGSLAARLCDSATWNGLMRLLELLPHGLVRIMNPYVAARLHDPRFNVELVLVLRWMDAMGEGTEGMIRLVGGPWNHFAVQLGEPRFMTELARAWRRLSGGLAKLIDWVRRRSYDGASNSHGLDQAAGDPQADEDDDEPFDINDNEVE